MKKKVFSKTVAQLFILAGFATLAIGSSGTQRQALSSVDWRGAVFGGVSGYDGYIIIGSASSETEAQQMGGNAGYSSVRWDSVNGNVYAK